MRLGEQIIQLIVANNLKIDYYCYPKYILLMKRIFDLKKEGGEHGGISSNISNKPGSG